MKHAGRRFLAGVLTAIAIVAIVVTLVAHYVSHVLVSSEGFSSRAVSVVQTAAVESLIVESVTDRLSGELGDQAGVQSVIEDAVRGALSNGQITAEIRVAARSLHRELLSGRANALTLTLPELGSAVAASIESSSPQLADEVSRVGTITVVDVQIPPAAAKAAHDLAVLGRDSALLLALTVAMVLLALVISPDRRGTLRALGIGAFAGGLLVAVLYFVGRGLAANEFSTQDARTAARAAWSVYLGGLEVAGLVLAVVGAVIAFAATLARPAVS